MSQTGISDAELARSIGVRRQTIFRWKEGLVSRPRHREDVLRCARRLRLTGEERDALLVAAGFPPEDAPSFPVTAPPAQPVPASRVQIVETATPWVGQPVRRMLPVRWMAVVVVLVALGGILLTAVRQGRGPTYPVAGEGETLIVVGRFVNYAGGQQGYNVAGRVRDALEGEIEEAQLAGVRIAVWPEEIGDGVAAEAAGQRAAARLVIWGEYDIGRVVTRFTSAGVGPEPDEHQFEELLTTPADLTATINSDLPRDVRSLGLLTLGRLYVGDGDLDQAQAVLSQALAQPPAQPDTRATLNFLLGYVHQKRQPPDLNQAIEYYSEAVALRPAVVSAYRNRGLAYLDRGEAGDLDRAIEDLTQVVAVISDDVIAYNNRGTAYLQRDGAGDLGRAVDDFSQAIHLAPDAPEAYFNRGLAYVRQGKGALWREDFERVLALDPNHVGVHNGLCWAYALDRQPALALPYCDRAVALDLSGFSHDSRGVVHAELGRFEEAAADFETFLKWLREQPEGEYQRYGPKREGWLQDLEAGRNPFDAETLEQLRRE